MKTRYLVAILFCFCSYFGFAQALTLSIAGHDSKCNGSAGGSAVVTVSGGTAPYSYSWSPLSGTTDSIGALTAGVYSVTVTDSVGAIAHGTVTISQPAPLVVTIDSDVVFPCFRVTGLACACGNTLWAVVTGGTPPYSYLWSPGTSADDNTADTLRQACYELFTCMVTDSNNCNSFDSLSVVVPERHPDVTTSVAQVSASGGISVYPNPATGQLNIYIGKPTGAAGYLTVYSVLGVKLLQVPVSGSEQSLSLDLTGLAEGNYLFGITGNGAQLFAHFSVVR